MSSGTAGSRSRGHEAEVGGGELPLARDAVGVAQRLELLEVRELAHVDLRGEVAADRVLERLAAARGSRRGAAQAPAKGVRPAARGAPAARRPAPAARPRARRGPGRQFSPGGGNRARLSDRFIDSQAKTSTMSARSHGPGRRRRRDRRAVRGSLRRGRGATSCSSDQGPAAHLGELSRAGRRRGGGRRGRLARAARGGHAPRRPRAVPAERGARRSPRRRRHASPTSSTSAFAFDDELGLEGGHSRRRVVHARGAATGAVIARVLAERVLAASAHPRARGRARARALAAPAALRRRRHRRGRDRGARDPARHRRLLRRSGRGRRIRPARSGDGIALALPRRRVPSPTSSSCSSTRPRSSGNGLLLSRGAARRGRAAARRARRALHRRARAARRRRARDRRSRRGAARPARRSTASASRR